eukprot:7689381-Pyramimonas_sp.AAC.1
MQVPIAVIAEGPGPLGFMTESWREVLCCFRPLGGLVLALGAVKGRLRMKNRSRGMGRDLQ